MAADVFAIVAPAHREFARSAAAQAFGRMPVERIDLVSGGASGASVLRAQIGGRPYLIRVEGPATALLPRNPHRYACTQIAAAAGLAPEIHHLDEADGVLVTDFVEHRRFGSFPGGSPALARALGELLARLQTRTKFPRLVYYPDLLTRMLGQVREGKVFATGLLDEHAEHLARLRREYDREETLDVSSHNDPNPSNILFDGARLWLIDWEAAYRNDPLVDVSILLDSFAPTPELEERLLSAWLGRAPDEQVRARLATVRAFTRLYYACFLLTAALADPDSLPDGDLSAPTPIELKRVLSDGTLKPGTRELARTFGKVYLRGFLSGDPELGLREAVATP